MYKQINLTIKKALLALLFILSSCSTLGMSRQGSNFEALSSLEHVTLDFYVSRATLTRTEFEQFKLNGEMLFSECGLVLGGRQSPQQNKLKRLSDEESASLLENINKVLEFSAKHNLNLDPPASSTSMFDAGQFILKISRDSGSEEIKTTLDSVVSGSKTSLENLKKLARSIREAAMRSHESHTLCGNRRFHEL